MTIANLTPGYLRPRAYLLSLAGSRPLSIVRHTWLRVALLAAWFAVTTWAVHASGGTKTVVPQLFHPAVLLAGFWFGPRFGAIAGVIAGLCVGPWMPVNVESGEMQATSGWVMRGLIFVVAGVIIGLLARRLTRQLDQLAALTTQSIRAFVRTIDAKSPHTAMHSEKVAEYAAKIGAELGMDEQEVARIYWAALLHDIGKLRVPSSILNKPSKLDREEWEAIRNHPIFSVQIIGEIEQYKGFVAAIRSHHERWDGSGYPDGIVGDAIPLEARIIAVADAFDAMTSDRPYRAGLTEEEALRELRDGAGSQFDPQVVDVFIRWRENGCGSPAHAVGLNRELSVEGRR